MRGITDPFGVPRLPHRVMKVLKREKEERREGGKGKGKGKREGVTGRIIHKHHS